MNSPALDELWIISLSHTLNNCPLSPPGFLYLIIAHELGREECACLMAQQQILVMIQNNVRAELTLALAWYKRPSCGWWVKSGLQWEEISFSPTGHTEWAGHKHNTVDAMWLSEREDKPPCDQAVSFWESLDMQNLTQSASVGHCYSSVGFMVNFNLRMNPQWGQNWIKSAMQIVMDGCQHIKEKAIHATPNLDVQLHWCINLHSWQYTEFPGDNAFFGHGVFDQ